MQLGAGEDRSMPHWSVYPLAVMLVCLLALVAPGAGSGNPATRGLRPIVPLHQGLDARDNAIIGQLYKRQAVVAVSKPDRSKDPFQPRDGSALPASPTSVAFATRAPADRWWQNHAMAIGASPHSYDSRAPPASA